MTAIRQRRPGSARGALWLIPAFALCLIASACSNGSSAVGSSASTDTAKYQAAAEQYSKAIPSFTGPTSGPAPVAGKKLMVLSCTQAAEGCALPAKAAVEAAHELGWQASIFDGQGNPDTYNKGIQQAITQGVDGILMIAVSSELVSDSVAAARKAGITVISEDSGNTPSSTGVNYENNGHLDDQAKALADYLIWKTAGKAKVLLMWDREFKSVLAFNDAFKKEIQTCGSCKIADEQDFVVSDLQSKVPQQVVSALRQNPSINAVVNYDAPNLFTVPEVKAAGLQEQARIGGFNGISPAIDMVRSGDVAATVGQAMEWSAWASIDNFNRIFSGQPAVDENVPMRLITSANVTDIEKGKPWDGDVDFRAEYRKLWGK